MEYVQTSSVRHRVLRRLAEVRLSDEVSAFFKSLPTPVLGLVITEDWCPTAPPALAMLVHCRELSGGHLDVRVFKRGENPDLMDQYLKDGKFRSVPVVAFFDEQFRPLGDIREKPVLPEWVDMNEDERRQAEASMGWSEVWGRAYMAILRRHVQAGVV